MPELSNLALKKRALQRASADKYDRQLNAGVDAVRKRYPQLLAAESQVRSLVSLVLDVADEVDDPAREWTMHVVSTAAAFVEESQRDSSEDSLELRRARRELQECFSAPGPDLEVKVWELRNGYGEIVGTIRGSRADFERAQAALR